MRIVRLFTDSRWSDSPRGSMSVVAAVAMMASPSAACFHLP